MLNVNEQLERIVEVGIVLLVGVMISTGYASVAGLWLAALLFLVIRPVSVWVGVLGEPAARTPRKLLGWFGIRGIGSVYYGVYAASRGLAEAEAEGLLSCTFTVIAASIVVHGVSATPLMDLYHRRGRRSRPGGSSGPQGGQARIAARHVSDKR
jgi:NhaP-type Na+/H+ or K+/H+ antiporter